jgi:hypothetical protein
MARFAFSRRGVRGLMAMAMEDTRRQPGTPERSLNGHGLSVPPDLAAMLEKFLDLLDLYKPFIEDPPSVRESAVAVRSEVKKPSPNWGLVRGLLRGIAAGVGGVAALTGAVTNIQNLILYTFS